MATKTVDRRKIFYFSKKNDDLLEYVNSFEQQEQSKLIMKLIRFDLEKKEKDYQVEIESLKHQLDEAKSEIEELKEELIRCRSTGAGIDEEVLNKVLFTLADIKRDNDFIKSVVSSSDIQLSQPIEEIEPELSPDEELELMELADFA